MKRSPEIEAVIRRLLDARTRGDHDTIHNLYSHSEDLRSIGSDAHEWFKGAEEVIGISKAHGDELEQVDDTLLRLESFENGPTGWAALEQKRTLASGDSYIYRMSIVLQLEAGAWKIVHLHFSIPVPNVEVTGVELTSTLSSLLESIDSEAGTASLSDVVSGTSTIVFTDIVGSTEMSQAVGDFAWTKMISGHFDALRAIVEREGGSVVKTLGDGGMFAFPTGASALNAAISIQRVVSGSSEASFSVRVGVHTGDVVQSRGDFIGLAVSKAARVAAAAEGDEILVSAATAEMVNPTEFDFGDPITVELKGIDGTHMLKPLHW